MAQTETRPGFRLPWTAERSDSEQPDEASAAESPDVDDPAPAPAEELVTPDMTEATATDAPSASSTRRPTTKFMADLSRAMQAAAESSRDETMARFSAEAKVAIEEIRTGSADEAAGLRRQADDDVAAVREWSKGEIARIREETDERIAARKRSLDGEMEEFAAMIEARVERVSATVAEFETEMAEFFERMLAEEDPTRIATMAEAMPDPPDLAGVAASVTTPPVEQADPRLDAMAAAPAADGEPVVEMIGAEPVVEMIGAETPAAVEEIQGATEAVAVADDPAPSNGTDFAAAEAEAATFTGDLDDDDGLATLGSAEREAAPSADTAPAAASDAPAPAPVSGERVSSRVVVQGLVSVASIATFKRSLGRVSGVSAIGVASGPDGEFVFTVSHDSGLGLADAIRALPGFDAKVTAETPGGLEVAAHDPDAGA
jgi:hypothetical protein